MNLKFFIALRYLFAKKSHNVINIISAISITGIAIGVAAMILVMSVYNGFDKLIESNVEASEPDILIVAENREFFNVQGSSLEEVLDLEGISSTEYYLESELVLLYGNIQGTAVVRGVDSLSLFDRSGRPLCRVSEHLASKIGLRPYSNYPLMLIRPEEDLSDANFTSVGLYDTFSIVGPYSDKLILVPTETMRDLLGLREEISGIALRFDGLSGEQSKQLVGKIDKLLPDGFKALTRQQQQDSLFKMLRYEKLIIFLILCLMVLIVTCTVSGCLTMLRLEKQQDMTTLRSLGMDSRARGRIFLLEGMLSSGLGIAIGAIAGVGLALLQQFKGIIRMPDGFMVQSYPVDVNAAQVLLCCAVCSAIGFAVTVISSRRA